MTLYRDERLALQLRMRTLQIEAHELRAASASRQATIAALEVEIARRPTLGVRAFGWLLFAALFLSALAIAVLLAFGSRSTSDNPAPSCARAVSQQTAGNILGLVVHARSEIEGRVNESSHRAPPLMRSNPHSSILRHNLIRNGKLAEWSQ